MVFVVTDSATARDDAEPNRDQLSVAGRRCSAASAAGSDGGSVTTVTAYPAGYSLTIVRVVPISLEICASDTSG